MGYSGFKGIGPNKIGANKGGAASPAKMYGGKKGDESKSKKDYESPAKQTAKQKKNLPKQIVDAIAAKSPAKKMNSGMSYDIKEASDQSLSKSARKHYAENAQAANKGGYGNKEKGSPAKQAGRMIDRDVKSKKEMRYDKIAQKAENAAVKSFEKKGNIRKNVRLIDKANKLNKKNNLGNVKLAKG